MEGIGTLEIPPTGTFPPDSLSPVKPIAPSPEIRLEKGAEILPETGHGKVPETGSAAASTIARVHPNSNGRKSVSEFWERLRSRTLANPDRNARAEGLHELARLRTRESVEILLKAIMDDFPGNRRLALQSLWRSSVAGLDFNGRIAESLKNSRYDHDRKVSALAKKGVEDLHRLKFRRWNPASDGNDSPTAEPSPRSAKEDRPG